MPEPLKPKFVIECQRCSGSLTIIYGIHEDEKAKDVEKHLVSLMQFHLKSPLHKHPSPPPPLPPVQNWVRKVRPVPKPRKRS